MHLIDLELAISKLLCKLVPQKELVFHKPLVDKQYHNYYY